MVMGNKRSCILTEKETLDLYYGWLCDLVAVESEGSFDKLIADLYNTPFFWTVPNDDNRAFEGKNLRERFCEEENIEYIDEDFDAPCSMLELIIALAHRCENTMADNSSNMSVVMWFWKLVSNAGLIYCEDNGYDKVLVDRILMKIIERTYHRNGKGGLFPLRKYNKDQRKVELWYQMSNYLVENYYTDD